MGSFTLSQHILKNKMSLSIETPLYKPNLGGARTEIVIFVKSNNF